MGRGPFRDAGTGLAAQAGRATGGVLPPLAIAAEHATFAKPEISLGFPPPFGGSQRLPRHVGRKRGLEMILTGDPIPAARAAELGLVNTVVPADELLDTARDLARRIIRYSPTAVSACLRAVTRGSGRARRGGHGRCCHPGSS